MDLQSRHATLDEHFDAAVAGIEEAVKGLPPELKKQIYDALKKAAKDNVTDPLAMALRAAEAKVKIRGTL